MHDNRRRLAPVLMVMLAATLLPAALAQAAPTCFGRSATIVGTNGSDKLVGTNGPDVIVGRGSTDYIYGRGGSDRICGGAGEDRLYGGRRGDRMHAGLGDESGRGSLLYGGRGNDLLLGSRFGDGERLYGGRGDDTLRAFDCYDVYADELYGGAGDDVLEQGAGEAWLAPGRGADQVDGGSHERGDAPGSRDRAQDVLDLSYAPRALVVELAAGTASGEGIDRIAKVEVVIGGQFDDRLDAGGSATALPAALYGMAGNDEVAGTDANDELYGEGAAQWANAMDPPNLAGEPGNDTVFARGGNDMLNGGPGEDTLDGGDGTDTCTEGETLVGCES